MTNSIANARGPTIVHVPAIVMRMKVVVTPSLTSMAPVTTVWDIAPSVTDW